MNAITKKAESNTYVPFPVDLLPEPIKSYVQETSAAVGCPPIYIVLPLLSCIGQAIGSKLVVSPAQTWEAPPIFWTAIIGKTGTTKSPALRTVKTFFKDLEDGAHSDYETAITQYEADLETWKKKKKEDRGEKPVEPTIKRFYVDDTTMEALVQVLDENEDGVLVITDELKSWFASFDRYVTGKGGDATKWLTSWNGDEISVDRKTTGNGKKHVRICNPVVNVAGTIQPEVLRKTVSAHVENGLFARLLFAYPPSKPQVWNNNEIDEETTRNMKQVFDQLVSARQRNEKVTLTLSDDAMKVWEPFFNANQQLVHKSEGQNAYPLAKHDQYALRIALILHVIENAGKSELPEISEGTVKAAVEITHWFRDETLRVYDIFDQATDESKMKDLLYLIGLRDDGKITVRDLQRSNSKRYPNAEFVSQALQELADTGRGHFDGTTFCVNASKIEDNAYEPRGVIGDLDECDECPF